MKTITISTENSETYSSISNFFIDYYMTDANGEFVKVYLYLIRLLNSKQQISVAEIADHFNLTEKDICRAIKYWVTKDALRLTFDGKGQPTGIVVLPLKAPEMELSTESDAFPCFVPMIHLHMWKSRHSGALREGFQQDCTDHNTCDGTFRTTKAEIYTERYR